MSDSPDKIIYEFYPDMRSSIPDEREILILRKVQDKLDSLDQTCIYYANFYSEGNTLLPSISGTSFVNEISSKFNQHHPRISKIEVRVFYR